MISYNKLDALLKAQNLTKTDLTDKLGISSRTIAKMNKGEKVANNVLTRIADFLKTSPQSLFEEYSENVILQTLRDEKKGKISGGLYHEVQVRMTYNSNHIEGSKLTEDQTRLIFETHTVDAPLGVPVDDVIETVNHFRAIDYVIDVADEPLSEEIIKHIHLLLKQGTTDSTLSYFKVGDYKAKPNMVGGNETANPKDVPVKMKKLVSNYLLKENVSFEDIVEFHSDFEHIHPFQDGNGRVGRLIAFKECLKNNIVPFIIEDSKKHFYYRGLSEWSSERGYLIETCYDGQDTFKALLSYFGINN